MRRAFPVLCLALLLRAALLPAQTAPERIADTPQPQKGYGVLTFRALPVAAPNPAVAASNDPAG